MKSGEYFVSSVEFDQRLGNKKTTQIERDTPVILRSIIPVMTKVSTLISTNIKDS